MAIPVYTTATVSEAPRRISHVDLKADYMADVSRLLSSPITSYDDSTTVAVEHRQTHEEHLKARVTAHWVHMWHVYPTHCFNSL